MYSEVFNLISTTADKSLLKDEIESLLESLYKQKDGNFDDVLSKKVRKSTAEFLHSEFSKDENKELVLKSLLQVISDAKVVVMVLAIEPSEHLLTKLINWVRENLGRDAILQIDIEEKIVGGIKIEYGGKYHDYSVSKMLFELPTTAHANSK